MVKEAYGDTTSNVNVIPDLSLIHNNDEGILLVIGYN